MKETQIQKIPNPVVDPVGEAHAFYTAYYMYERDDSPTKSRESMIGRMERAIQGLSGADLVLDIGAGIQVLEAEYLAKNGHPDVRLVALDISEVDTRQQLLATGIEHIVASGTHIPLPNESVALAVSNMALDFIPKDALHEVARILKPEAQLLLNMHHPSLIPPDLNRKVHTLEQKIRFQGHPPTEVQILKRAALQHKRYLMEHNILYKSTNQIRETFEQIGFDVQRVEQVFGGDTWWEADMIKKAKGGVIYDNRNDF